MIVKYLLIGIFLLGIFIRFYKLDQFPIHLGHDEITQLYDAISIAQTGRDIYGNSYPFIFKSVNDFKPPFYTYATIPMYYIFGWNEVTIRIVGALFGSLVILGAYFFVKTFLKNKAIALFAAFLAAISPFEVFYSRKSFENQSGIFLMLLGFTLLLIYTKNKKIKIAYLAALVLGVASYVYFAQAVLIPLLLIVFIAIFFKQFKLHDLKPVILFFLIIIPLFYMIFVNPDTRNRSNAVFITQDPKLGKKLTESNSQLQSVFTIAGYSLSRYVKQFNPSYLFLDGLNMTDGKRDVGPLFAVSLPFLILGIYLLIKEKNQRREKIFILTWILISMIPSGLTFENYSPHRAIAAFTMLNIIVSSGIYLFFKKFKIVSLIIILILFGANFAFFIKRYTINYPIERSEALHYPLKQVSKFAWENHDKYDQIIIDSKFGEFAPWIGTGTHYYLGFYGMYPPERMQKEFKIGDQTKRETKFDKFSIRAVYWPDDKNLKNTLIIASRWSLPDNITKEANIIKEFYFKTTAPAFYAIKL